MLLSPVRSKQRFGGALRPSVRTGCARVPKCAFSGAAVVVASLLVAGCPVFSSDSSCWSDDDCAPGFLCRRGDGRCFKQVVPERSACSSPDTCAVGETCASDATCVPGDCTFSGCISGWRCDVFDGRWSCVGQGQAGGGAAG